MALLVKRRKNMYAVKAIYDGVNFKPKQPISVKGPHEVVIMFIEPISKAEEDNPLYLLKPDVNKTPVIGRLNGIIKIPDEFYEPLDEMKEYMF
jgi:predicted DNA-binding antitoxin AbrB/MazE fold protein